LLKPRTVLVAALLVPACASEPAAIDFSDPLTGPVSPALTIPFEKYGLTAAGLQRTHSESGTENGIERPVVRTASGAYMDREFVFEVDVTIPADHGDIAYVGFGSGRANAVLDNEPSHAFLIRIHNLPRLPFYGIDLTVADPQGGSGFRGGYRHFQRIGEYTPGRAMRLQIRHEDGKVTLAVPAVPEARAVFDLARFRDLFTAEDAHLFLANSSEGTTFTNASLRTP
jgi:hypothetical protein